MKTPFYTEVLSSGENRTDKVKTLSSRKRGSNHISIIAITLSLFVLVSPAIATEKLCLSSEHQSFTLPDKNYLSIHSKGHYALLETYEETEERALDKVVVLLLDLRTGETTEFLTILKSEGTVTSYFFRRYGFSKEGSLAWGYKPSDYILKIRNLSEETEVTIPFMSDQVFEIALQEDGLTLGGFEIIWPPLSEMIGKPLSLKELLDYFNSKATGVFHTLNLRTLHQTKKIIPEIGTKLFCYGLNASKPDFFFINEDGSVYKMSLIEEGEPIKIFDAIEGFSLFDQPHFQTKYQLSSDLFTALNNMEWLYQNRNCSLNRIDSLALMRHPKKEGYILRLPKEGKEFFLPLAVIPEISKNESFILHIASSPLKGKGRMHSNNHLRIESDEKFTNNRNTKSPLPENYQRSRTPRLYTDREEMNFTARSDENNALERPEIKETRNEEEGIFLLPSIASQTDGKYENLEHGKQGASLAYTDKRNFSWTNVNEEESTYSEKDYDDRLFLLWQYIKYPFVINPHHEEGMGVYHIPEKRSQTLNVGQINDIDWEKTGLFSFETTTVGEKQYVQAFRHPFDPDLRTLLLEWNEEEVCYFSIDERNNSGFVNTTEGDFFIFNLETGTITQHFVGGCFSYIRSFSPTTFLFYIKIEDENTTFSKPVKIKSFKEQCVELTQPDGDDIQNTLLHLEKAENPTEDSLFPLLIKALEQEEEVKGHPTIVTRILWNVLRHSPTLYLSLHRRYPFLGNFSPPSVDSDFKANKPYLDGVLALLKLTALESRETRLSEWNFLRPLRPFLKLLSATERNLYIEKITISLTNGATREIPLFQDIFQSKLYYTAHGHVKELFGLPRKPVSDITIARGKRTENEGIEIRVETERAVEEIRRTRNLRGRVVYMIVHENSLESKMESHNTFTTVILASDPIERYQRLYSVPTDFGIHYAVVKTASGTVRKWRSKPGTVFLDSLIQWKVQGGPGYRAWVKVSVKQEGSLRDLPFSSGPDYSAVWQDGRRVGVVIVGSSLRGFSRTLLEQYFSYFKEAGFEFSGGETDNLKDFLLERIQNCEMDYFLKESHSGGDERNMFRIDRKNHIVRGVRSIEGGQEEVIYLIFPKVFQKKEGVKTDILSYEELHQAMALREANNCGQVTYFNTGCWSIQKAVYEIEAVNSPLFLNIPSIDNSETFYNSTENVIRALLDSYRGELNFDGFRKALTNKDPYIFPDEPLYQQQIFDRIQIPLDIHISLERQDQNIPIGTEISDLLCSRSSSAQEENEAAASDTSRCTWQKITPDEAL